MEVEEMEIAMEISPTVGLQPQSPADVPNQQEENPFHPQRNEGEKELKPDVRDNEITAMMEVIAATGKFWHDWETLKSLLSHRLKQVLAEYPEAQEISSTEPSQSSLAGETYEELVKRLGEELLSFTDGPPFTLQRLCEILLAGKQAYSKLSKLALALEKNLLVTSMISISTDPYPGTTENLAVQPDRESGGDNNQNQSSSSQNGVDREEVDVDEEMTEADFDEDNQNSDAELKEQNVTEESNTSSSSKFNTDTDPSTEPDSDPENVNSAKTHAV